MTIENKDFFEDIQKICKTIEEFFDKYPDKRFKNENIPRMLIDCVLFKSYQDIIHRKESLLNIKQNIQHILFFQDYVDEYHQLYKLLNKHIEKIHKHTNKDVTGFLFGQYFENSIGKEERKSTGSYYTPIYLVQGIISFLIKEQIQPFVKDLTFPKDFKKGIEKIEEFVKQISKIASEKTKHRIIERLLSIKILDPSIGAGHFILSIIYQIWTICNLLDEHLSKKEKINRLIRIISNNHGVDINQDVFYIIKFRILFMIINILLENSSTMLEFDPLIMIEETLTIINNNFKRGNSIDNFDWKGVFPHIFNKFNSNKDKSQLGKLKGGFDIIIGNPPHGAKIPSYLKTTLKKKLRISTNRSSQFFIIESLNIIQDKGICALIIPKQFSYNDGWKSIRDYLFKNHNITRVIDLGNNFQGQLNEQILIQYKKKKKLKNSKNFISEKDSTKNEQIENEEHQQIETIKYDLKTQMFNSMIKIPLKLLDNIGHIPLGLDKQELEIAVFLGKRNFSSMDFLFGFRGIPAKFTTRNLNEGNESIKIIEKRDVDKFRFKKPSCTIKKDGGKIPKGDLLKKEKIIAQRIMSFTTLPQPKLIIKAFWDPIGLLTKSSLVNIYIDKEKIQYTNNSLEYPALCLILNSNFISWYAQHLIYTKYFETSKDFDVKYVKRIPLPIINPNSQKIISMISIMIQTLKMADEFLEEASNNNIINNKKDSIREKGDPAKNNSIKEDKLKIKMYVKEVVNYFFELGNELVFELYFVKSLESQIKEKGDQSLFKILKKRIEHDKKIKVQEITRELTSIIKEFIKNKINDGKNFDFINKKVDKIIHQTEWINKTFQNNSMIKNIRNKIQNHVYFKEFSNDRIFL